MTGTLVIDDSVTSLGENALACCENLTGITIPDSVTTIYNGAFAGCTDLDLTVPDTVTTIDEGAFQNVKHVTYNGSAEDTAGNNWGALSFN